MSYTVNVEYAGSIPVLVAYGTKKVWPHNGYSKDSQVYGKPLLWPPWETSKDEASPGRPRKISFANHEAMDTRYLEDSAFHGHP